MREVLVKAVNEDYGDALDALASNGLPVAMVWGEHDTAATTAMAERARARIGAHADLVVVPGSAHLLDDGAGRRAAHRHRRHGRTAVSATANVLVGLAISLLALASYLRWWRVAQREHYEPGRLVAMAAIWCRAQPVNLLALAAVLALCLVGPEAPAGRTRRRSGLAALASGARAAAADPEAGVDSSRTPARGRSPSCCTWWSPASSWPSARRSRWCRCWRCRSPRSRCWPRSRWRTSSAGATRSRPPRRSSRSRRGWWRSPGPTARPRPRTTPRT